MNSSLYPEQLLKRRTMAWALKLRVNPQRVMIEDLPQKWGSCSPDGVVTLAEDLVKMESDFQDYVIVHELLHLRYGNHGRRFKAMMTAMVPRWREFEGGASHGLDRRPRS